MLEMIDMCIVLQEAVASAVKWLVANEETLEATLI
jgi:hypothetical protein